MRNFLMTILPCPLLGPQLPTSFRYAYEIVPWQIFVNE
jgi:hypothetical protein